MEGKRNEDKVDKSITVYYELFPRHSYTAYTDHILKVFTYNNQQPPSPPHQRTNQPTNQLTTLGKALSDIIVYNKNIIHIRVCNMYPPVSSVSQI